MKVIKIKPIGFARNGIKKHRFGGFVDKISEIIVDKRFIHALDGIGAYSHIIVVYWMDKVKKQTLTHRPQGNPGAPVVGIFASRCPGRPNPVALTTVKLIKHKGNSMTVEGLDVLDGTPIIDIKPYWPQYDEAVHAKVPSWVRKLKF